jgi:hypothetical protein
MKRLCSKESTQAEGAQKYVAEEDTYKEISGDWGKLFNEGLHDFQSSQNNIR